MKLTKVIASRRKADGTWEPQRTVELHPLEESALKADWALDAEEAKIPPMPSKEEEHEWLIEHGPEFIKQKRIEHLAYIENAKPALMNLEADRKEKQSAWDEHARLCVSNGHDKDTFKGDARATLRMPMEKETA